MKMNLQSASAMPAKSTDPDCAMVQGACKSLFVRDDPPALSLDERGVIHDCSISFEKLFGFLREELVERHISTVLPQLTGVELVQAGHFNPLLNYLCRCGHHFLVQNQKGDTMAINLNFVHVGYDGSRFLKMFVHTPRGANV
jgi:hypothetical protein